MKDTIQIGDFSIDVTRKPIKHVHLSVHPPDGRVLPASSTTCATFLIAATRYEMNDCLTTGTKAIVPAFPGREKVNHEC